MADLLTDDPFPREVLADCARREVAKRRHVYQRLVAEKKMTQMKADREIEMMQAIVDLLDRPP